MQKIYTFQIVWIQDNVDFLHCQLMQRENLEKFQWKSTEKENTALIIFLQKADQMIWPIQQRLFLEDATPRDLVIGKDIADDRLYTNIFGDGSGCHLHVVGELLERPPVLTA